MIATVEDQLKAEAMAAGVGVPEMLLRRIAENMYWLNVMLARELNGGTTTAVQTTPEQQAERFAAWLDSFHEASGRTAARTQKAGSVVTVTVKPFAGAPIDIELRAGIRGHDERERPEPM